MEGEALSCQALTLQWRQMLLAINRDGDVFWTRASGTFQQLVGGRHVDMALLAQHELVAFEA
jgi:hypothetical protein